MSAVSGYLGSQAQTKSAQIGADASLAATQASIEAQNQATADATRSMAPYYGVGIGGVSRLQSAIEGRPVEQISSDYRRLSTPELENTNFDPYLLDAYLQKNNLQLSQFSLDSLKPPSTSGIAGAIQQATGAPSSLERYLQGTPGASLLGDNKSQQLDALFASETNAANRAAALAGRVTTRTDSRGNTRYYYFDEKGNTVGSAVSNQDTYKSKKDAFTKETFGSKPDVYYNDKTGQYTLKPPTTTYSEKGFDDTSGMPSYTPTDYQYIEPGQYNPYNYNRPDASSYFAGLQGIPEAQVNAAFNPLTRADYEQALADYKPLDESTYDRIQKEAINLNNPYIQAALDESRKANERASAKAGQYFNPNIRQALEDKTTNQMMYQNLDRMRADAAAKYGALEQQSLERYNVGRNKFSDLNQLGYGNLQAALSLDQARNQAGAQNYNQAFQTANTLYGLDATQEELAYQRSLNDYKVNEARNAILRQLQDTRNAQNLQNYQMALGTYNLKQEADNRRYQRLLDLTKIGTGNAATAGQWNMQGGTNIANTIAQSGTAQQQAALQAGQAQANMWNNIGNTNAMVAGNLIKNYSAIPAATAATGGWASSNLAAEGNTWMPSSGQIS